MEFFTDATRMYTALTFITICTLLVEIICIRATSLKIAKSFENVFYLLVVASVCEWMGIIGIAFSPEARNILTVIKSIELMIAPVIPVAIALSVIREKPTLWHVIPLSINVLIIFSSIFTGKIFYFEMNNVYRHGDYYFLYQIAYFSSVIFMIVRVVLYARKESQKSVLVLALSFGVLIVGILIQAVFPDVRIDWCTAAMASTLVCLYHVTQDQKYAVDEMKKAMDEANRANMAKTSFMGRMSHDIRTPINGIMGMVQIAKKNIDNKEVVDDCLSKIDYSNKHLLSLISDILQMTSLESGAISLSYEKFDIIETIGQCMDMLSTTAKDRGVRLIDDGMVNVKYPKLIGSPVHVRQVFTNIVSNAIKYNKIGGFVELKTTIIGESENKVTYRFTISDTGLGMSDEFLARIFEPFSREDDSRASKRPGSGLGMSIVKELVTLMGGSISVISEKNVGSVFTVDLPFEIDRSKDEDELDENRTHSFEGKRVLLVEDNDLNQEIALYMLKEKGFEVETASNGKEAVGRFISSSPFYYDIILMDIMMPVMNGLEATKEIRGALRPDNNVPIIAMTANAYEEDRRECLEVGMNQHIAKPLEEKEIMKAIEKYL